jgi:diguanylate cyclase (GGDEF)-like protein
MTILAVFIWCAAVSSIDQLIHDQITVFILGIFGAATFCLLTNYISLIIYAIASVVFFVGITWLQPDPDILQGHYINGAILVVLGWAMSRVIFYNRAKDFANLRVIERQNALLERMSIEDHLTGLHNRRYLQAFMEKCLASAERFGQHLTFAIADIDRFKAVNDEFSHQAGDAVLKTIARIFKQNIRKTDDVSRYGGEEFIFVLDRASLSDAARLCEKIRDLVERYDWDRIAPGLRVTISFGLAEVNSHQSFDEIFRDADQKLYEAKKGGRNQVKY